MKKMIVIFCLLLAGQARADEWTSKDTAWEATYLVVLAADWSQTLYIASHPEKFHEVDAARFIGLHPSRWDVNTYFLLSGLVHVVTVKLLPQPYRRYFQYISIGYEANTIYKNYQVGIGFAF